MPLIFVHHHKNEVAAFNTECTIGSLNTALADLANNGDNNSASKSNLSSYFSPLALRSKANDRGSQPPLVEDFAKERISPLTGSPHLYKKVELLPLSFVTEIASNPKLTAALYKRSSSSTGGALHPGGSPPAAATVNPTDGNSSNVPVSTSLTSFLASYISNIPFIGLRTAPEQNAYFSLPGFNASNSNCNTSETSPATYPALILLGCRIDPSKESRYFNHLGGPIQLPSLDDRRSTAQPDPEERKAGSKTTFVHDSHGSSRLGQQVNPQLQLSFASYHAPDSNSLCGIPELGVGASKGDNSFEMNGGIPDKMFDHVSFTGMLNFIKNTRLTPHRGSKGARGDVPVLITHPIPPELNEEDPNAMEMNEGERTKSQGTSTNEDNTTVHGRPSSSEETTASSKKNPSTSLSQLNGKETNRKKSEMSISTTANSIGVNNSGIPPIPLSCAAQKLLLSPRRTTSLPTPAPQTNSTKPSSAVYAGNASSAEKPQTLALWLKGVESLDVLWVGPNGEHEVLSRLLQEFVRIEKQKIAADEVAWAPMQTARGASVLAGGGPADAPKGKK